MRPVGMEQAICDIIRNKCIPGHTVPDNLVVVGNLQPAVVAGQ